MLMRKLLISIFLLWGVADGVAVAQSTAKTKPEVPGKDGTDSPAQLRKLSDEHFAQCMRDWEVATHMSKQDWAKTCRRVVDRRVKFMQEHTK
jgi:hypothetical protein